MDPETEARLAGLEARVAALEARLARVPGQGGAEQVVCAGGASPEVLDLVAKGNLIKAIKVYRHESGAGLREAKQYVEGLAGR